MNTLPELTPLPHDVSGDQAPPEETVLKLPVAEPSEETSEIDSSEDSLPVAAVTNVPTTTPPKQEAPFVIQLVKRHVQANGFFRPDAYLILTSALRTAGLLRELPAEDLQSLLYLLTFLTPNGDCLPSIPQLTSAMQTSERSVRARMERLQRYVWQGEPLVHELKRETGMDAYTPSHLLVRVQQPLTPPVAAYPYHSPAGRQAVISHSRRAYARPRAEVERQIAELNGWDYPIGEAAEDLSPIEQAVFQTRRRLQNLGIPREQAEYLLAQYPLDAIQQQLEWLPYRGAKIPAKFVVAAIQGGYEAPLILRQQGPLMDEAELAQSSDLLLPSAPEASDPSR